MNNLTKDELIEISDLLLHGFGESVKRIAIFKKIKSMISDFCEHHWIVVCGRVLSNGNHVPGMTICDKCGTKK